jgi:D-alanyl-lipoteichoic acid acyltransferase DltB (MBOAT superfamily)
MFEQAIQIAALLGCILAGRLVMKWSRGVWRDGAFAALNLAAVYFLFFHGGGRRSWAFPAYLALAAFQYVMLRLFAEKKRGWPWLAFFTPIAALILARYVPRSWTLTGTGFLAFTPFFIGLSYLAFRSSLLVLEIRNGRVPVPNFLRYLGFCFFVPTMSVGPISPYENHHRAFTAEPPHLPAGRAWQRILVGFVKYRFVGSVCYQLTYGNLLFDDHYHPWIDLPVAMVFYYLYLYCNFSGFCDVAIGAAGLIGIPVAENFNDPFRARNIKELWNRWHITLSQYMRDVLFAPLSKYLVGLFGAARTNLAIAVAIVVVFLLIGIWHGVGWNYAVFGLAQALGVVAVHYYTVFLKKRLGRDGFKAYNDNRWIRGTATTFTFCYYAATLIFFANTLPQIREIFSILR